MPKVSASNGFMSNAIINNCTNFEKYKNYKGDTFCNLSKNNTIFIK